MKVSILDSGEIFDSAGTVDLITSVTGAWNSCRALLSFFLSFECLYRHYVEIEMIVILQKSLFDKKCARVALCLLALAAIIY